MTPHTLAASIRAKFARSKLSRPTEEMLSAISRDFGNPPREYLDVLAELGWGEIGRSSFMLYEGPVRAAEIFPDQPNLVGVLLIGDNLAGYHVGYKMIDGEWMVVEFDHSFPEDIEVNETLSDALACILSLPG